MEDMEHAHLEEGDLDLLLAAEPGEAWLRSLLHKLAVYPECYRIGGFILDLYRGGDLKIPFGPVDLALARSRAEAPGLWQELEGRALADQRALVQSDRRFASWGLCELLCQESERIAAADAAQAIERAELAVLVADLLEDGEPVEDRWIYQLRGYAWAIWGTPGACSASFRLQTKPSRWPTPGGRQEKRLATRWDTVR